MKMIQRVAVSSSARRLTASHSYGRSLPKKPFVRSIGGGFVYYNGDGIMISRDQYYAATLRYNQAVLHKLQSSGSVVLPKTPAWQANVEGIGDYAHDFFNSPQSRPMAGLGDVNSVLDMAQMTLGMQGQVGTAKLYPELRTQLDKVYRDRIAQLQFVPKTWLPTVLKLQGTEGGILLFPIRATNFLGMKNSKLPAWVTDNADAWNMLADESKKVIQKYMDGKIAEGRVAMNQFYSDESFWGSVRNKVLAAAQIAVKIGEGTKSLLAPKKTLIILAGVVVVGIIAWKNPRILGARA